MKSPSEDTIVAIASPSGSGLRGIVRLAGDDALELLSRVAGPLFADWTRRSRMESFAGNLNLGRDWGEVPCQILLWPHCRSYTGQPQAELHLPGSPPLLHAVVERCTAAGARLAGPGEFTLRAFLAGRIDLTQAEAVLGVIEAESGPQLTAALTQLAGGLAQPLGEIREQLLDLLARLEAGLDFVDEDIEFVSAGEIEQVLGLAATALEELQAKMADRGLAVELPRVALVGRPNAGKSSLFNALLGREAAIVSSTAGTTRDYLEAAVEWNGLRWRLIDTAGFNPMEESAPLPAAAQRHAHQQREISQVRVICLDGCRTAADWAQEGLAEARPEDLVVITKCDRAELRERGVPLPASAILTSSRTGEGLEQLREALRRRFELRAADACVAGTAARCATSIQSASASLAAAAESWRADRGEELVAAELRNALGHLGEVVGAVYTDDLLDRIFSRFCIGK